MHAGDDDGVGDIAQGGSNRGLCPIVDIEELGQGAKDAGYSISRGREMSPCILTSEAKLECFHACGHGGAVTFRGSLTVTQVLNNRISRDEARLRRFMLLVEAEFAGIQTRNVNLDGLELGLSGLTSRARLIDLGSETGDLRLTRLAARRRSVDLAHQLGQPLTTVGLGTFRGGTFCSGAFCGSGHLSL